MTAKVIDGKAFAANVRARVAAHVARLGEEQALQPGLAVVLVGEDPASQVHVRHNGLQTVEAALKAAGAEVVRFERLAVGEGIEKVQEDYLAEVAKAMQV